MLKLRKHKLLYKIFFYCAFSIAAATAAGRSGCRKHRRSSHFCAAIAASLNDPYNYFVLKEGVKDLLYSVFNFKRFLNIGPESSVSSCTTEHHTHNVRIVNKFSQRANTIFANGIFIEFDGNVETFRLQVFLDECFMAAVTASL